MSRFIEANMMSMKRKQCFPLSLAKDGSKIEMQPVNQFQAYLKLSRVRLV